jgi:hypothetical protein
MNVKLASTFVAAVLLSGCVSHTWAPGPTAAMPFPQASGQCKLVAMGAERGTFAFGRPAFVAGAAIGSAIGNAVRQNTAYNACMEAQGFVALDTLPQPAAAPASAAAPVNANKPYAPGQYYTPAALLSRDAEEATYAASVRASACGDRPGTAGSGPGQRPITKCGE